MEISPKSATNNGHGWTHDEHVIAFNLYCQLPFGKLHKGNPRIRELAALLGRTPDALAMKLGNFASLDPFLQRRGIRGLTSASKGVEAVWEAFREAPEHLAFESERLMSALSNKPLEQEAGLDNWVLPAAGQDREALVRVRVNQNFFRKRILSAYDGRCCVTGLAIPDLLVASHIVPWSNDVQNRLNPRNGLCLNAFHDRAFDRGFMWIEDDFVVRISPRLGDTKLFDDDALAWTTRLDGMPLRLPKSFTPDPDLLRRHRESALTLHFR